MYALDESIIVSEIGSMIAFVLKQYACNLVQDKVGWLVSVAILQKKIGREDSSLNG